MFELLRSNDLVRLSWAQAMLQDAGIPFVLLDQHMSSVEGGISALQRRLLVPDEDAQAARRVLVEAERDLDALDPG